MQAMFSPLPFARKPKPQQQWALPAGERLYAIGDIHGRLDCLNALLAAIDRDDAARGPAKTTLVFLGDLIDRGPESQAVVERLIALAPTRACIFLMGNHEEILIGGWEGDARAARLLQRVGGRETLLSYGVPAEAYDAADAEALTRLIGAHVPLAHIAFLRRFADVHVAGDYLFVHAGIRPGIAIEDQAPSDLRWIRNPFLTDSRNHGKMVIHGHSITADVEERPNRIGIDTGAVFGGALTCVMLEADRMGFLQA